MPSRQVMSWRNSSSEAAVHQGVALEVVADAPTLCHGQEWQQCWRHLRWVELGHGYKESEVAPNELKLSDRGWRKRTWSSRKNAPASLCSLERVVRRRMKEMACAAGGAAPAQRVAATGDKPGKPPLEITCSGAEVTNAGSERSSPGWKEPNPAWKRVNPGRNKPRMSRK